MKKDKLKNNPVAHPAHYTSHKSGIEAIEMCGKMGFCTGNAFKYCFRMDNKGKPIEDLRKARWYIQREMFQRSVPDPKRRVDVDFMWEQDFRWLKECTKDHYVPRNSKAVPLLSKIVGEDPGNVEKAIFYIWLADGRDGMWEALRLAFYYIEKEIRKRTRAINKQKKETT
jgi:hypothetical protein